jgi:isopentenyl-diphosphate Delta-isomerase
MEKTNIDVVLVNKKDEMIGRMEKLEAHQKGVLHRAFSIILCNNKGELLIHQRALNKYHSAGLWTNTCCSHPTPDETMEFALNRRLKEELNIDYQQELFFSHHFIYKTALENDLTEYELDHVFVGFFDQNITPNKEEVMDWKYLSYDAILMDMSIHPSKYTFWFKEIMNNHTFVNKISTFNSVNS